eukprot:649680-Rhodomonas_salina.1
MSVKPQKVNGTLMGRKSSSPEPKPLPEPEPNPLPQPLPEPLPDPDPQPSSNITLHAAVLSASEVAGPYVSSIWAAAHSSTSEHRTPLPVYP